jgi:hypothetical protein
MLVEVCHGVCGAYLRQASTPRLEPRESHVPLEVGGVLGATARLYPFPDCSGITVSSRRRAILVVVFLWTVANFAHDSVLLVTEPR